MELNTQQRQFYLDAGLQAAADLAAALSVLGLSGTAEEVLEIATRLVMLGAKS